MYDKIQEGHKIMNKQFDKSIQSGSLSLIEVPIHGKSTTGQTKQMSSALVQPIQYTALSSK